MSAFNVNRDGDYVAGPMTHNEAFRYILDHQSGSFHHATTYEGWSVDPHIEVGCNLCGEVGIPIIGHAETCKGNWSTELLQELL